MGMFTDDDVAEQHVREDDCTQCKGTGFIYWSASFMGAKSKYRCDRCGGTGKVTRD